jgi:hypothetical protein
MLADVGMAHNTNALIAVCLLGENTEREFNV